MRKTIKNNEQMLVIRETEGEFKGLTYQVMKLQKVLMVFVPKTLQLSKTSGNTLCVNEHMVMTSMAWDCGDNVGVLYPNTDRPFFDEATQTYCKGLAEKYCEGRFAVRPQFQLAI